MNDDEWLTEQQRLHNLATYHRQPRRIPHQPYTFTTTQLRIALDVYDHLPPARQSTWIEARNRTKDTA